jgi:hypothetical protein
LYKSYEGAPAPDPVLSKNKGLNRFVWNLRTPTMPGVPNVYIESSYSGHKAPPGKYSFNMKMNEQILSVTASILPNLLYNISGDTYKQHHQLMLQMENEVTAMHNLVNKLNAKQEQLEGLLATIPKEAKYDALQKQGQELVTKLKAWDEEMIQRKSKAYDDVENFPNKFTANYLFLVNQTESDLPQINQSNLDLKKQLDAEWLVLKNRATELSNNIAVYNKLLWENGVGAIWKE